MVILQKVIFRDVVPRTLGLILHRKATMRAWQAFQYGGLEQLQLSPSVQIPAIQKPNELLVEIHAASVNPIDVAILGGYGASTMHNLRKFRCSLQEEFPLVLGRDFAGVVKDIGQGQAARKFKKGDEVWGVMSPLVTTQGSLAEYTVVPCDHCSLKPSSLTFTEAASFPYIVCTAWAAIVTFGRFSQHESAYGKRVLILGGSGGVGTYSIQLLKAWGADVTTTCSDDAIEKALELGADIAIDYKSHDVLSELKKLPKFDLILDGVFQNPIPTESWLTLLRSGAFAHYVTLNSPLLKNNDELGILPGLFRSTMEVLYKQVQQASDAKQIRWAFFIPSSEALKHTAGLVEAGKVQPVIEKVLSFHEVPEALDHIRQQHARGKTVIEIKST